MKFKLTDDDWIGLFFIIMALWWCPVLLVLVVPLAGTWKAGQ